MINKAREIRIREKIRSLSLREKALLVAGGTRYETAALPERDIRSLKIADFAAGVVFNGPDAGSFAPSSETGAVFPSPASLARCFDTELVRRVASQMADECRTRDIELLYAPLLSLKRDPADGWDSMRLSEDPVLAGEICAAFVNGMADRGVTVCLGGFGLPGKVSSCFDEAGTCDPRTLNSVYLKPAAVAMNKCNLVAVSPCGGRFADDSHRTALREAMDFSGAVMDLTGGCTDAAEALLNGIDYVACGGQDLVKDLMKAVESGRVPQERLDEAALRVLYLYYECVSDSPVVLEADPSKSSALAFQAAKDCMVLLKNEDAVLPLKEEEKIAVIGSAAKAGCGALPGAYRSGKVTSSLLQALDERNCSYVYAEGCDEKGQTNPGLIEQARAALREAGKGILAVSLPAGEENVNWDREDLRLPDGMLKLADLLLSEGLPLICVLLTDSPLELPFADRVKGVLLAGHAGEATAAAAVEILYGHVNPSGKLAQTWPVRYSELPVSSAGDGSFPEMRYNGYMLYESLGKMPRWRFGFGLSYSALRFIGAKCERHTIAGERQRISITYSVQNISERSTMAALQFYVGEKDGGCARLAAVTKLSLLPGEVKIAQMDLPASMLNEYDPQSGKERLSAGDYLISISHSSGEYGALGYFTLVSEPRDGFRAGKWPAASDIAPVQKTPAAEKEKYGFTLDSSLEELSSTFAGRALYEDVRSRLEADPDCADGRFISHIMSLPVRMLPSVSRNAVNMRRVRGTVNMANGKALRGVVDLLASRH